MSDTILLIGTLDTKGEEYRFVRDLIHDRGAETLVMDAGVLGDPLFEPDVSAEEVAEAGGAPLGELREQGNRGDAMEVMTEGLRHLTKELYLDDQFDGVLGLGGGGGTQIITAAMRELPVGVPKLMVSTVASGDVQSYVAGKDITMMHSVVDIAGLNRISRRVLANAAGAIRGMVDQDVPEDAEDKPLVAATMFGVTTPCVNRVRELLEEQGFEVVVFHATGTGGRSMEGLIEDGYFDAVADITTTEWCDEVVGGVLSAGEHRLEAAADNGLPQVVSCGALDMVNFHAMDTVPEAFRDRNLHRHNANVTLMRTTPEECREIGQRIAEKVNRSTGPTTVLLPLNGVSMIDQDGEPFHDPEADEALFDALRDQLDSSIKRVEKEAHINDDVFAEAIADELVENWNAANR